MGISTKAPVVISNHARARLLERWPAVLQRAPGATPRSPLAFATWEVHEALRAGRTSKKLPREYRYLDKHRRSQHATKPGRLQAKGRDTPGRYAWSADGERCYVLHWRTNIDKGGVAGSGAHKVWVVSTVLPKARDLPATHPDYATEEEA